MRSVSLALDDDDVEGRVESAVAALVQPVSEGEPRACGDRAPASLAASLRIRPGDDAMSDRLMAQVDEEGLELLGPDGRPR